MKIFQTTSRKWLKKLWHFIKELILFKELREMLERIIEGGVLGIKAVFVMSAFFAMLFPIILLLLFDFLIINTFIEYITYLIFVIICGPISAHGYSKIDKWVERTYE